MTAGVLDEYGGEALHRAEGGTVNHHRCLLLVVFIGIFELEALGQVVVHLDGAELPATTYGVLYHEVELRTVECCLAVFYLCVKTFLLACFYDSFLCECPVFVATYVLLVVVRVAE